MGTRCCVPGCSSNKRLDKSRPSVSVFKFPLEPERRQAWISWIREIGGRRAASFRPGSHSAVCALHFLPAQISPRREAQVVAKGDQFRIKLGRAKLAKLAVPSIVGVGDEHYIDEVEFKPEMWEESSSLSEIKREQDIETMVKKEKEDDPDLVVISDGEDREEDEPSDKPADTNKKQSSADPKSDIVTCCALGCPNTSETFSMQTFPTATSLRRQWINRIDRLDWLPHKTSVLCEIHFDEEMWEPVAGGEQRLRPDAVPTLFLHGEAIKSWVTLDASATAADANNGTSNLDAESQDSIYSDEPMDVKQEALEPEIAVVEGNEDSLGDDGGEDEGGEEGGHFETIYCDSPYDGLEETVDDPMSDNDCHIVKNTEEGFMSGNSAEKEGGAERGKLIVLNKEQLNQIKPSKYKRRLQLKQYQCPICDKELSRRKNLELHVMKFHKHVTDEEMQDILTESCAGLKYDPKKKKIDHEAIKDFAAIRPKKPTSEIPAEQKPEAKAPPALMPLMPFATPAIPTPITTAMFPTPRVSAPSFVMAEAAKANPEDKKQYVLVLQQPPPSTPVKAVSVPPSGADDVFSISLANVPLDKRDTLREKLRELVTAVAVKDLDPHRIIIAYDRT